MTMTRTRRPGNNCVAWILLLTQLIHNAPRLYCCAFQTPVAPSTTTTTRRRRRPSHPHGCLPTPTASMSSSSSSSSCPPNRLLGATRRRAVNGRISWNANHDRDEDKALQVQPRWRPLPLTALFLSASSDDAEKDAAAPGAAADADAEAVDPMTGGGTALVEEDDEVSSSGVTRTLLLAVPLFCKFVLVLMIKFVTDLIVYPLLLLYRGARITKRRVLRMLYGGSGSSSSSGRKSVNGEKQ